MSFITDSSLSGFFPERRTEKLRERYTLVRGDGLLWWYQAPTFSIWDLGKFQRLQAHCLHGLIAKGPKWHPLEHLCSCRDSNKNTEMKTPMWEWSNVGVWHNPDTHLLKSKCQWPFYFPSPPCICLCFVLTPSHLLNLPNPLFCWHHQSEEAMTSLNSV